MRKILPSHFRRRKGAEELTSDASSAATPSASNKSFPSGIKPLYTPNDAVVDIVFIHGLTGDRERTWTAHDADEPWPKTLLPSQLPKARTLTYGYDAYVTNWTGVVAQSRVHNHAWGLLTSLATYREQDDSALTLSSQKSEDRFRKILHLTLGIAFLGTPHQGAGLAIWAEMISRALGIIKKTNTKIVAVLKQDSEVLARIQDGFHTIVHERSKQGKPIEITCFFEELPYRASGRNHMDIARFSSSDDTGFQAICGELRAWTKGIATSTVVQRGNDPAVEPNQIPTDVPCNRNPDFVGRTEILEQLRQQLGHERDQTRGKWHLRAAIHGLGGIGKTQIALEYVYRLQEALPAISIFWVHASNVERFQQSYAEIAKRCQIPGYDDPKANLLQLVKEWLSRKECGHWFMVVDNADDTHLFFANRSAEREGEGEGENEGEKSNHGGNLGRYLPECCHGSILITTRNKEAGSRLRKGKYPTEIGGMEIEHATRLLQTKFEGADFDLDSLPSLILRLEGLPLALVQAAAYILEKSITVDEYLALLGECDQTMIDCLSEEFETDARDEETPRAVAETWILSFEQIRHRNILAADLLSLMSFFDRQAIPKEFLASYSQQLREEAVTEKQLTDALGLLRAFSFITQDTGHGRWDEAEVMAQQVMDIYKAKFGQDHPYTLYSMSELVAIYHSQSRWDEAEQLGLQMVKGGKAEFGEDHWFTLNGMGGVAAIYQEQGRWKEAQELAEYVLGILEAKLGEDHPFTLNSMGSLGAIYWGQGRFAEAEALELRTLEIRKVKFGEDHPDTLSNMLNLAYTWKSQGRLPEALELMKACAISRQRVLGPDHPDTRAVVAALAGWPSQNAGSG
ncbi:unnamed protein product [Parascedosporium putredinis]|uniref:NB-ARC domain-containing protein n=1 Tax=Parascedosporium putredinis TaxID=1442378 RepID=A0A9P1MCX7_9PEZI|nr:unnamed protein product [Parascedosporium putredinis]CAI8002462.1 unnamed protein product [Parascedosporium putredinis]